MLSQKRIISYELNEVPLRILDAFVARYPDSALAKLNARSRRWETVSPDSGQLVPWSSWSTQHRGVNNDRHQIANFGQDLRDVDAEYPPIWQLLARGGVRTGMFGPLNSYPLPDDLSGYTFYVPDTFAAGSECFPGELSVFQEFNLRMVDLSARNASARIVLKPAFDLLRNAPGLGIRGRTFASLGKQLLHERLNKSRRGRRRTSQVVLAFDLFLKQLRRTTPDYAAFFTNHVASSMHRYWPALFPDDYQAEKDLPPDWHDNYGDEIFFTMREASRQIGELARFADRHRDQGYVVMVSSSMGQAAVDNSEVIKTQLFIGDCERFMRWLGVEPDDWQRHRAMIPRWVFQVSDTHAATLRARLPRVTVNGEPLWYREHSSGVFAVRFGQPNLDPAQIELALDGQVTDWQAAGLEVTPIPDATGSYAYHIPEGILLIYDPAETEAQEAERKMPTTEIAPLILRNYGLSVPAHMSA